MADNAGSSDGPNANRVQATTDSVNIEALRSLAAAIFRAGRLVEAVAPLVRIVNLRPADAAAHDLLGRLHMRAGALAQAQMHLQMAVELDPTSRHFVADLGRVLERQDQLDKAAELYRRFLFRESDPELRVRLATMLPTVYTSVEDLGAARRRAETNVAQLCAEGVQFDPDQHQLPCQFRLAYQGLPVRELLSSVNSLHRETDRSPDDDVVPGHTIEKNTRIRIGFVSQFFGTHSIGKLTLGLVARLSRARFEVHVLALGRAEDVDGVFESRADRYVEVPRQLNTAVSVIRAQALDILVFPDIGMSQFGDALARRRLAPVQCTTWGHPVTSGMPTIDYFISSDLIEPPDAEREYVERLVRLNTLPSFFYRPQTGSPLDLRSFGITPDSNIYGCPQSLFKFHPDFDTILEGILERDTCGILLLVAGADGPMRRLVSRWRSRFPHLIDRIRFIPRQANFIGLLASCHVLLDPIHFGSGVTAYEAVAAGTPLVTLPGEFMRGRVTYGLYRKMQVLDCVAESIPDYINRAVTLATNAPLRAEVRKKIRDRSEAVFEDEEAVLELERFFAQAVIDTRNPQPQDPTVE